MKALFYIRLEINLFIKKISKLWEFIKLWWEWCSELDKEVKKQINSYERQTNN